MNKKALSDSLEFIDSWLQFRYGQEDIPGYVVAVAHKGQVIFNKAYGYADLEKQTKLTTDHLFRIASYSKTFTATAIMLLVEQGKLRIDDYVVDYLPWLKVHKDKRMSKVTIRQLMSHGAGVIRDGKKNDFWQLDIPFPNKKTFQKEILECDLVIDTNLKMKYSDYGYTLLGLVIEAITVQDYNDFVSQVIIKPLKLTNTFPEYNNKLKNKLVTGYSRPEHSKKRIPIAQVDTRAMSPATGFCSTSEDLCTYFSAHMVGSNKLLSDESKKEMQRVQWHAYTPSQHHKEDYGLGFEIEYFKDRKVIGHGGGFPGHITKSSYDPKNELVVEVLTNCIDGPASLINKSIFNIIDYFQKNTLSGSSTIPKHDLKVLKGRYINLWAIIDVVVVGDKLVITSTASWDTLYKPQILEYIDDTTFKAIETDSYDNEGEIVKFNIKNTKVDTIDYYGATMWPEAVWRAKQAKRKIVG